MASDWYEEMEKAEQEYDAREYELAQEYSKGYEQGRADAIDEIIEYYKPCNDCGACLEYDRDYFQKRCEMDMQISYTELVEYLEQLKEQK